MDGGAWKTAVHWVPRSWTWLSDFPFTFHFHALEKEMATHPSVLAWRIPGTGEPGGLHRVYGVCGVTQSRTQLKRLSSSSSTMDAGSGSGIMLPSTLLSPVTLGKLTPLSLFFKNHYLNIFIFKTSYALVYR